MVTIDPVHSICVTVTCFNYTFCVRYRGQKKDESDKMFLKSDMSYSYVELDKIMDQVTF